MSFARTPVADGDTVPVDEGLVPRTIATPGHTSHHTSCDPAARVREGERHASFPRARFADLAEVRGRGEEVMVLNVHRGSERAAEHVEGACTSRSTSCTAASTRCCPEA